MIGPWLGMMGRLAFSIAAMIRPQILIADEVFATGNLTQQRERVQLRSVYLQTEDPAMIITDPSVVVWTNLAIAAALLSIGTAVFYSWLHTKESRKIKSIFLIYCLFYFVLAANRLTQFLYPHASGFAETSTAFAAAVLGIIAAAVVWPQVFLAIGRPTRDQLEAANAELKAAEDKLIAQQRLFETFMQNAPALAYIKDGTGKFIWANERCLRQFKLQPGQQLSLPPGVLSTISELDQQVLKGDGAVEIVESVPLPDETTERHWFTVKFPIDTERQLLGGISVDITSQKNTEKVISDLNDELAQRIYQLAEANAQLHIARDQAIEASELKTAFLANISHELRTPLSGIIGMNELLLEERLTPDQKQLAETVQASAEQLLAVINDVLDLSKMEAGRMRLEVVPFNITYLVHSVSRQLAEGARNKGLTLSTHVNQLIPEFLFGDPARVRQILTHLIGNAVKFTDKGRIDIETTVESEDENVLKIRFAVRDTGKGIEPTRQAILFQPFVQEDNSNTRRYGGPGLGLTIAKRFVEMMGGEIGFESELGKGSLFWFVVPFAVGEPKIKITPKQPPWSLPRPIKALVVEDNQVLQDLALRQLAALGIDADLVNNGIAAVENFKTNKYDVILMDCHLPIMSGYEATESIRDLEHTTRTHVPIIAMTAAASHADMQRCADAGMDGFLAKPVILDELKEAIRTLVFSESIQQ